MSFALEQRVQDSTAGFSTARVVPAHHVVRSSYSLEEFLVHILGTAVVGHIGQVDIDGRSGGDSRARFLGVVSWKCTRSSKPHWGNNSTNNY